MQNSGKIATYGHSYGIKGYKDLIVIKNSLYEKCLPGDTVNFDIIQDTIIITEIVGRNSAETLTVVRGIRETGAFFCLPLISTIFNQEIQKDIQEILSSKVGDMWRCALDIDGIHLIAYVGNAFNLRSVKDYIRNFVISPTPEFRSFYEGCFESGPKEPFYTRCIRDLTDLETFSVDNKGTRDIDDCISIDYENGIIYVHIVDISSHLIIASEDDIQAAYQSYTVYLPDATITCLPPQMSESKLSLTSDSIRKVITVELVIDRRDFTIHSADIYPSTIINKENMTYKQFDERLPDMIQGKKGWISKFIERWWIRRLEIPNLKLKINKGIVEGVSLETTQDPAHRFIETLMVCCNLIISTYLKEKGCKFPEKHGPSLVDTEFVEKVTDNYIVNVFLSRTKERLHKQRLTNIGYFGLELTSYSRFTSPIRRQSDTILHRLLAGYKYHPHKMGELIAHMENKENQIKKITQWYYSIALKKYLRENWNEPIEGWVLNVYPHGIDFVIPTWILEGYIHVSKLADGIRWKFSSDQLTGGHYTVKKGSKILIFHEGIGIINIKFTCTEIK